MNGKYTLQAFAFAVLIKICKRLSHFVLELCLHVHKTNEVNLPVGVCHVVSLFAPGFVVTHA